MLRALFVAAATVVAIWGATISADPVVMADAPEVNCTQFNEDGSCYPSLMSVSGSAIRQTCYR